MFIVTPRNNHQLPMVHTRKGYSGTCTKCGTDVILERKEVRFTAEGGPFDYVAARANAPCIHCRDGEVKVSAKSSEDTVNLFEVRHKGRLTFHSEASFRALGWGEDEYVLAKGQGQQ